MKLPGTAVALVHAALANQCLACDSDPLDIWTCYAPRTPPNLAVPSGDDCHFDHLGHVQSQRAIWVVLFCSDYLRHNSASRFRLSDQVRRRNTDYWQDARYLTGDCEMAP